MACVSLAASAAAGRRSLEIVTRFAREIRMKERRECTGWPIRMVKTSCWLSRFGIICRPAWAVGSYSSSPSAARTVGTKSTGSFCILIDHPVCPQGLRSGLGWLRFEMLPNTAYAVGDYSSCPPARVSPWSRQPYYLSVNHPVQMIFSTFPHATSVCFWALLRTSFLDGPSERPSWSSGIGRPLPPGPPNYSSLEASSDLFRTLFTSFSLDVFC